ncbi:hypothetical protein ACWA5G_11760 [Xanthomonas axonopodis pv. ricini]
MVLITCAILISPKRFFRQGGLAWSLRRGAIKLAVAAAEMNNGVASGTFSEIQYFLLSFCVGTKYVSFVYQGFGLFGSTPPIFSAWYNSSKNKLGPPAQALARRSEENPGFLRQNQRMMLNNDEDCIC